VFGTRITYARRARAGAPKEIWWAEFGATEQVQVSHDGTVAMLPAWAPGGAIAWTGYRRGTPEIWMTPCPSCPVRDPAGGPGGILSARPGQNSGIAFSPDGRYAAVTLAPDGNPDIWLIDARTGRDVARLTNAPAIDTSPTWSPDGRRIAFVTDRGGGPQIWVMASDGRDAHALPLPGSYNTSPDWSPDGGEIAYQNRGEGSRFSIWTYGVDTGAIRRITGGPWDDEEPAWSPDGRMLVFTSTRKGQKLLYVVMRDGTHARPLFKDGGEYFGPAWERPSVAVPVKRKATR
jgi:TolB protein